MIEAPYRRGQAARPLCRAAPVGSKATRGAYGFFSANGRQQRNFHFFFTSLISLLIACQRADKKQYETPRSFWFSLKRILGLGIGLCCDVVLYLVSTWPVQPGSLNNTGIRF